ncbi:MAG: hypothetical protein AAGD25_33935 [Cyanobacteria bacterium P01_F01_bin.150]
MAFSIPYPISKIAMLWQKLYSNVFDNCVSSLLNIDFKGQEASDLIAEYLNYDKPCLIAKIGANELDATLRHMAFISEDSNWNKLWAFLNNDMGPFWWDLGIKKRMALSGLFPTDDKLLDEFSAHTVSCLRNIDVFGCWLPHEYRLSHCLSSAKFIPLSDIEPYYHQIPWTLFLRDKKVLVVNPFARSIESQYRKRDLLFNDKNILPEFKLKTFKTYTSLDGKPDKFSDWFEALDFMCDRISEIDFDIALVTCASYGLPISSFIKSIGKKAINMGGSLQILFGIKGKRWDKIPFFQNLYNDYWVRPSTDETPELYKKFEGGCYW